MLRHYLLISFGIWLFWLGTKVNAGTEETIQTLRKRVVQANNFEDVGEAYWAFFTKIKQPSLKKLLDDDHTGLALHAAWELYKKTVSIENPLSGKKEHVYLLTVAQPA